MFFGSDDVDLSYQSAQSDAWRKNLRLADEALVLLGELKKILTIPAAEYVPAIPDAWLKIEAIESKIKEMN